VVRRGELRPVSGSYGELSRWEFKTLGTGRVYVRRAPREVGNRPHPPAPSPHSGEGEKTSPEAEKEEGGQP